MIQALVDRERHENKAERVRRLNAQMNHFIVSGARLDLISSSISKSVLDRASRALFKDLVRAEAVQPHDVLKIFRRNGHGQKMRDNHAIQSSLC